jgi:hypothetical protein
MLPTTTTADIDDHINNIEYICVVKKIFQHFHSFDVTNTVTENVQQQNFVAFFFASTKPINSLHSFHYSSLGQCPEREMKSRKEGKMREENEKLKLLF